MNKIATTIVQSKRLIELGLDKKSADMCHRVLPGYKDGMPDQYVHLVHDTEWFNTDIPAWSLSALLEMMPQRIVGPFGELWHLGLEKDWDKVSYIVYYENKNSFVQRKAKDPIDACIEMIDWLIKNGQKLL